MLKKYQWLRDFVTKEIWLLHLNDFSPRKALSLKAIRVLVISIRGIYEDKIQQRAAALTLYTMLSIVPVLALGFGIAKGFGYDQFLETKVKSYLNEKTQELSADADDKSDGDVQEEIVNKLISFANAMLSRTKGGLVAGIGIGLLFYTVMKVLGNIEESFNDIWQVKKGRPYIRKFSDYLSLMLISPIFFITASAVNVYINNTLTTMSKHVEVVHFISPVLSMAIRTIPYFLIIVLFTLMYIIMPFTKVNFRSAAIGGIVAGSVFQIVQTAYIHFQVGVSSNNAIYGSFAAIPLFILWLQISWLIVLFGAKISFASQNIDLYEFEKETSHMSHNSRRILALLVIHHIIQNFKVGLAPLTTIDLSKDLKIPMRMLKVIINDLLRANLIAEVIIDNSKINGFLPSQNIDNYTIKFIFDGVDMVGENFPLKDRSERTKKLVQLHQVFFNSLEKVPENILIKDI